MSETPYDDALANRECHGPVVDDELEAAVTGYLWTVSKDPAPERAAIQRWLRDDASVEWNGAYARSAASELRRWLEWMGNRSLDLDALERNGATHLIAYAERLRSRVTAGGITGATARTYFGYLRACLQWMVRRDLLTTNPAAKASVTEALPETTHSGSDQQFWTPDQRAQLLDYASTAVEDALDTGEDGIERAAVHALRDRALIAVLYYSAVRVGEIARRRDDRREGRSGLRWSDVDLARGRIRILGKGEQERVWHPLPGPIVPYLERYQQAQQPCSDDWPVFATAHAPSLWAAARDQLTSGADIDALVADAGSIHALLRSHDVVPPAITDEGVRSRLRTLTDAAGIQIDDSHGYLVPHGARRGSIGEVFQRDRGEAQDLGRHADLKTTEAAYRHLDVEKQRQRLDSLFADID